MWYGFVVKSLAGGRQAKAFVGCNKPKTPAKKLVGVFVFIFNIHFYERDFKGIRIPKEIQVDEDLTLWWKSCLLKLTA